MGDSKVQHVTAGNIPFEIVKTSADWMNIVGPIPIVDFDGWDRSNFESSFNRDLINYRDFMNRVLRSTIYGTIPDTERLVGIYFQGVLDGMAVKQLDDEFYEGDV